MANSPLRLSLWKKVGTRMEHAVLNPQWDQPEPFRLQELWSPVAIFLLSRLYVVCMFLGVSRLTKNTLTNLLESWDSSWYISVAQHGYATSIPHGSGDVAQCNLGFFPLWPLLIRFVHAVTGLSWPTSAVAATFVSGTAAAIAVWLLLRSTSTLSASRRGLSLVMFTPGAIALTLLYSEGLIVTFGFLALFLLRRRQWEGAALAAALCSLCDPVGGAAVAAVIIVALWTVYREHSWRPLSVLAIAPLGVLTFFSYLYFHAGSFFAWFNAQRTGWQGGTYFLGAPKAVMAFISHGFSNLNPPVKSLSLIFAVAILILFVRIKPPLSVIAYSVAVLFLGLLSPIIGITPRLLLRDSPMLALVGSRLNRRWFGVVLAGSCAVLGYLVIVSATIVWTP